MHRKEFRVDISKSRIRMMRSSLALLLASVALSSGCGDKAAVMQQCLAGTPEFASRLGSALQACGQVRRSFLMTHDS